MHSFSWKVRFLVFEYCPVPCILGVDFLTFAKVRIDFSTCRYSFAFQPETEFEFQSLDFCRHSSQTFPCSEDAFSCLICSCLPGVPDDRAKLDELIRGFPALFSDKLGTVRGMVCHLDLTDSTPAL